MSNTKTLQDIFDNIRSNQAFELFVIGIIVFSAVMIGAKTYEISDSLTKVVIFFDWFVTIFFMIEITIRFLGEKNKKDFCKQAWNIFDTVIVVVSLVPIEDSELAIIGRLIRIFRVLRMVSLIPELRMLLNSLIKALPRLGYVALLMFIIFYIYAAIGSTFFSEINPQLWGDIAVSLLTLFRVMTFEDWTDVMYETMTVYGYSWIFYLTFIFFTAFAFLNMIIGIVVNVLEEENKAQSRLDGEPTLEEIYAELQEVKQLLKNQQTSK